VRNSTGFNICNLTLAGKVHPTEGKRLMVVTPRPGRFTLGKENQYPLCRRLGGPNAGKNGCGNVVPDGIRSPDRPARSESLYGPHSPDLLILVDDI
jgi:hypothetical protein